MTDGEHPTYLREGIQQGADPVKAEEVVEIRVELKGHKGLRNLKIREFVRRRSPEIDIQFVDAEGQARETVSLDELSPPSEETKEWRDRNDLRADLAQEIIRATLKLFDLPMDPEERATLPRVRPREVSGWPVLGSSGKALSVSQQ